MSDRPARPPTRLQYLAWDGTDPADSIQFATGLATTFRCINLLDDCPAGEFGVRGSPRLFQPCGTAGTDVTDHLWVRGMFEFPNLFFSPTHNNAGNDLPAILQYSGHGIPGFMFSESSVLLATSRAMTLTGFTPATGLDWAFNNAGWDNPSTKVLIFSACRQLAGRPQQFHWANRMRGAAHRVHTLLSYRNTAPLAPASAAINRSFVASLAAGRTFIDSWRGAHGGDLRQRWAASAFRSSVNDRMDEWVRNGSLPAEPGAGEDILYFDEANRAGRVVTTPSPAFSMDMAFISAAVNPFPRLASGNTVPPWTIFRRDTRVDLRLRFVTDAFADGDKVWLGVLQVRPDYAGPFDLETVIQFVNHNSLLGSGAISVLGRLHDERRGYQVDAYGDVYEFVINRAGMPFATLDSTSTALTIPMVIGSRPNDHLPIFYMMVRVERGAREFGIPTDTRGPIRLANQARLVDEPQFCVFLIANS